MESAEDRLYSVSSEFLARQAKLLLGGNEPKNGHVIRPTISILTLETTESSQNDPVKIIYLYIYKKVCIQKLE